MRFILIPSKSRKGCPVGDALSGILRTYFTGHIPTQRDCPSKSYGKEIQPLHPELGQGTMDEKGHKVLLKNGMRQFSFYSRKGGYQCQIVPSA